MKKINIILAAATLFTGVAAQAQSTAKTLYTGTSFPVEQGWSELRLDSSVNPIAAPVALDTAGGVLKFSSANAPDQYSQLGWYKLNQGLDLSKGYTIELKAKLKVAKKGSFNIQGYDNSGKGFRVTIADTFLTNLSDPLKATQTIASGLTADDAFHVYRLAVKPSAEVDVYRDGEKIGDFALSTFQLDNIVENGGFEDEEFPDFLSNGILQRIAHSAENDSVGKIYAGEYALEANNEDKLRAEEAFRTRPFAVKPGAGYEISITRRRTNAEPYGWRDLAAYHDGQDGAIAGTALAPSITSGSINDPQWQIHNSSFTADSSWKSVRFEFPTWVRDNTKTTQISSLDNIIFRERHSFGFNKSVPGGINNSVLPEGYVNLITNGGFEDHSLNNDGSAYEWALSNEDTQNTPTSYNELWNGEVRIQKNDKTDDELGGQWAHSGTSSLRFSTLGDGGKNFDFTQELEPGKTYRFNFWHRSPKWPDQGWLKVSLGDSAIWGHELIAKNNVWANADLVFTATETHNVLHLYSADHGSWFNVYLDDLVLYEVTGEIDPQIAGKINLIANGDFEDATVDNSGAPYTWALASGDRKDASDNYPVAWSDLWGSYVRLQDVQKGTDTGLEWAHSGSKSLRVSYLDDKGQAQTFEEIPSDAQPNAYQVNINFEKELEANKTYTFVFWLKAANYPDKGVLNIANGDAVLWKEQLSTKYVSWTRQSITFSTTEASHTLRIFTEFTSWFNFYLDDLFLYEDETVVAKPNLIANGGFEDTTVNNNGEPYTWALASGDRKGASDNYPVAWNDLWGSYVRLQDVQKGDDTGPVWAHSGSRSLRISYLNDIGHARTFEGIPAEVPQTTLPKAYRVNINFEKELEANKTYTFEFWLKAANYTDKGVLNVANGDVVLWREELSNKYVSWTKHSITFSTTQASRTLRIFTEFTGWFNFYLDDLYLYEEDTYVPYEKDDSYIFFGKSQSTASADVEVEYVKLFTEGAHEPGEEAIVAVTCHYALSETADTTAYADYDVTNAAQALPIPEREYYSFLGWYDNADFTGEPVDTIPQGATGSKEYWGKWQLTAQDFTITYNENGGTSIPDSSYTYTSATVVLSTATEREHYTFAGWYANEGLTGEAVTEIPTGSVGNKAFWAKWTPVSYTITYYANGAVGIPDTSTVSYTVEAAVTFPAAATGYTIEWYDNEALTGSAATGVPEGSGGDKAFWAKSTAIRYTIQYQVNDGTPIPDSAYTIESHVVLPTATGKEGHTFVGWYTNYLFTGEAVTEIPAGTTGNKVFYAKWEADAANAVSTLYASGLRIYPNPVANGLLSISNLSGGGQVEIYSLSGALAASYTITGNPTVIDISALPAGTYIVKANGKTAKIVKE